MKPALQAHGKPRKSSMAITEKPETQSDEQPRADREFPKVWK